MRPSRQPLIIAGLLLGLGLGGFIDGIVFHQLLQLHNMLSAVLPPNTLANAEINMFWDGLFHAFTWVATLAGVVALWHAGTRDTASWSGRTLLGAGLIGWGGFNLVEGVIDHHLLQIHHVVERLHLSGYDYAFLGFGAALVVLGGSLVRAARDEPRRPRSRGGASTRDPGWFGHHYGRVTGTGVEPGAGDAEAGTGRSGPLS